MSKAIMLILMFIVAAALAAQVGWAADTISNKAPSSPGPVETVLLPKGSIIIVATRRSYKSYGASAGTKITYDVVQDAIVNGYIVAKAGDVAEGEVLNAREGETNWWTGTQKGANLRVSVERVYNFCGDTITMDFARTEFRNRTGLFGGKVDVEVSKGQLYQALTERPQRVCAQKTVATPMPIPSGVLEGDKA